MILALSPNGKYVATGAGKSDETIRIWSVFPGIRSFYYVTTLLLQRCFWGIAETEKKKSCLNLSAKLDRFLVIR